MPINKTTKLVDLEAKWCRGLVQRWFCALVVVGLHVWLILFVLCLTDPFYPSFQLLFDSSFTIMLTLVYYLFWLRKTNGTNCNWRFSIGRFNFGFKLQNRNIMAFVVIRPKPTFRWSQPIWFYVINDKWIKWMTYYVT